MSVQGLNSSFPNAQRLGNEHSRLNGVGSTLMACRMCDKIFLNSRSLIEHYECHQHELARMRHLHNQINHHQRVDRPVGNGSSAFQSRLSPSPMALQHQHRFHPYFPTGFGAMQQARNRVNPFLAASQSLTLSRPQNFPGSNNVSHSVAVPSGNSRQLPVKSAAVSAAQTQTPPPPEKSSEQKGFDETPDKQTAWYLGQLEKPIPQIIDLEIHDGKPEHCDLNLRLKI